MTPAEITALIGLITTLLPAGVTLVNDIRSLFQNKSITPDQLTALIALIGQDVANNTADTMKTAQADMALSIGTATTQIINTAVKVPQPLK